MAGLFYFLAKGAGALIGNIGGCEDIKTLLCE